MTKEEKEEIYRQAMEGRLQDDIVIMEDTNFLPLMNEEYIIKYIYIGICVRGFTKGQYDYKDFHFKAGDICWLAPNHIIRHDEISEDYSTVSLFIKKEYFQKLDQKGFLPRYFYPFLVTSISLNPQQQDLMLTGLRMIGKLASCDNSIRDELISKLCDIVAILGDEYIIQRNPTIMKTNKTHIQLFERFYDAITKHYYESREVSYYAHLLSLTPKYFATIIKQITGQSASDWINHYVIVRAKWLLQHEHHKTIQQISNQLGFTEQASFSRFFRDNTGMTPSAYRTII